MTGKTDDGLLSLPPLSPAAVLDFPGERAAAVVAAFAGELGRRGWRLGAEGDLAVADGPTAAAMMPAAVPLLAVVGPEALAEWQAVTSGRGVVLVADPAALWRWWGPHRLYRDLILGVEDVAVRRVVIGLNWVLVEAPGGTGPADALLVDLLAGQGHGAGGLRPAADRGGPETGSA